MADVDDHPDATCEFCGKPTWGVINDETPCCDDCWRTRPRTPVEGRILDALRAWDSLDHESLWLGHCAEYEPQAVSKAIQRLKRRGVIETDPTVRRGWYRIAALDEQ